jgi:hypothetical protein
LSENFIDLAKDYATTLSQSKFAEQLFPLEVGPGRESASDLLFLMQQQGFDVQKIERSLKRYVYSRWFDELYPQILANLTRQSTQLRVKRQ